MWHRLQEIYAEELPVLPLYSAPTRSSCPKWLTGIEPTGHQYPSDALGRELARAVTDAGP